MRVLTDMRDAFRMLGEMPGMGHYLEDLLDKRYKLWSVHSYVVVYRWEVTPIQIIAVVHGARDLNVFLSSRDV
jgi:plasmid stabilization system protein ParE